jgi:transposase InsO family protein
MLSEAKWVYERMKLHELIQLHPNWSIRQYAITVGHDHKWVQKWKKRLESDQVVSVKSFQSLSHVPKNPPQEIPEEAKAIVCQLREELSKKFHRSAGAKTILYALNKYRESQKPAFRLPMALSSINKILRERGYIQPRQERFREPLILPAPMEEWELDFGEIRLSEEEIFEFLLVIDRGSSRLVYLEGCSGYNGETALEAVARLFLLHGLPKRLRFDRDVRLWGAWTRDSYPSPMIRFLRVLGIEPVVCPPRRPDLKPMVERAVFTFKYEGLARQPPQSLAEALELSEVFPHYYNHERPHQGRACANRTPDEAFPNLPALPHLPETLEPDAWLKAYHGRVYRRRVSAAGTIQIDRHLYSVGTVYARQEILVHLDAEQKLFFVSRGEKVLKKLPIQGLYGAAMDFASYLIVMKAEARTIAYHYHSQWEKLGELA